MFGIDTVFTYRCESGNVLFTQKLTILVKFFTTHIVLQQLMRMFIKKKIIAAFSRLELGIIVYFLQWYKQLSCWDILYITLCKYIQYILIYSTLYKKLGDNIVTTVTFCDKKWGSWDLLYDRYHFTWVDCMFSNKVC